MSKRFKFKLPRVISSSLQMCRLRNPSNFPENPLPNKPGRCCRRMLSSHANPKGIKIGFPDPPPSTPEDDSFVSVKVIRSIGRPRRVHEEDGSLDTDSIEYSWRDDGRWHVVNKLVGREVDDEEELEPVTDGRYGNGKRDAASSSSSSSSVSMRVFSGKYGSNEESSGEVASVSVLRRTTSMERGGGKVRDSVAVVKRSENPLEDFRTSMIEMVVERRMFEAGDLERLLRCFLSLNSREYHGIIVEAFSELWQIMFCDDGSVEFTAG